MNENILSVRRSDKWIPWYFVLFFAVIALVDGTFVTIAIRTQTGTVTDRAYEKGLAYNSVLQEAAAQKDINVVHKTAFNDGVLSWELLTKDGLPVTDADITARFFRQAQDGYDFSMPLNAKENGVYESRPDFPLPGLWKIRLEAQWQDSHMKRQKYSTSIEIIAP